jgi:Flp pilus assembly protein TadB
VTLRVREQQTTRRRLSISDVSGNRGSGNQAAMTPSSIVVILIGIVLALLVNYVLGIIVILIGLAMLLFPMLSTRRV